MKWEESFTVPWMILFQNCLSISFYFVLFTGNYLFSILTCFHLPSKVYELCHGWVFLSKPHSKPGLNSQIRVKIYTNSLNTWCYINLNFKMFAYILTQITVKVQLWIKFIQNPMDKSQFLAPLLFKFYLETFCLHLSAFMSFGLLALWSAFLVQDDQWHMYYIKHFFFFGRGNILNLMPILCQLSKRPCERAFHFCKMNRSIGKSQTIRQKRTQIKR